MDFMICKYGYRKPKDNRVYCKKDDALCAHVYMCQLNCRWQQTAQAGDCPKAEEAPVEEKPKRGKKK